MQIPSTEVNISVLHHLCELNFARLESIIPRQLQAQESHWSFDLASKHRQFFKPHFSQKTRLSIDITVLEINPYTSTLQMHSNIKILPWLPENRITFQQYHDARMVEVVTDQKKHITPRIEFPNHRMKYRDEKIQINKYLGEWLQFIIDCHPHNH